MSILKVPQMEPIVPSGQAGYKQVLLNPEQIMTYDDIPEEVRLQLATDFGITSQHFGHKEIELKANNFLARNLLRAVLPTDELPGLSSFSRIGHIIHVNLKEELQPYKEVIGQILLQLPNVQMVVNKSSIIDSVFRNFDMEILARKSDQNAESPLSVSPTGNLDNDFVVNVLENGNHYRFDFSKVYWNPRLSVEHQRVVEQINRGDTVFDVFAGVGPFAVLAAKKGRLTKKTPKFTRVFANDLNPNSFDWLKCNFQLNKIPPEQYSCFNMDGKEFIKQEIKEGLIKFFESESDDSVHIIMNLPASAIDFLSHFHGLLKDVDTSTFRSKQLPVVHVYGFTKCDNKDKDIRLQCQHQFDNNLDHDQIQVKFVRNVAPNKDMMRATFSLTMQLLTGRSRHFQKMEEN